MTPTSEILVRNNSAPNRPAVSKRMLITTTASPAPCGRKGADQRAQRESQTNSTAHGATRKPCEEFSSLPHCRISDDTIGAYTRLAAASTSAGAAIVRLVIALTPATVDGSDRAPGDRFRAAASTRV